MDKSSLLVLLLFLMLIAVGVKFNTSTPESQPIAVESKIIESTSVLKIGDDICLINDGVEEYRIDRPFKAWINVPDALKKIPAY